MSEYCERCVHTDAEIARLTKERDEAKLRLRFLEDVEKDLRKLAIEVGYPEPQHGKGRHGLDCTTLLHSEFVSLRAQVAQMRGRVEWAVKNLRCHLGHGAVVEPLEEIIIKLRDSCLQSPIGQEFAERMRLAEAVCESKEAREIEDFASLRSELADARALLECVTEDEIGGTPNLFCPDGGWEQWWDKVKLFLARTKGQNE